MNTAEYIADYLKQTEEIARSLSKEEIARLSYNNTINLYKIDI